MSYLRAPYPQPHSSNPPRLESLTHSPESPHGSSRLHASWVLSSCPYPDLAPQGTSYRHLHSHKLGMPQGYPHTPSALIAHGAHTPMASLAPSLIPLLSRNPAHGSAPQDVLPTCPGPSYIGSRTLPLHLLCKYRPLHDLTCLLLCEIPSIPCTEPQAVQSHRPASSQDADALYSHLNPLRSPWVLLTLHKNPYDLELRAHIPSGPHVLFYILAPRISVHTRLQGAPIHPVLLDGACAVLALSLPRLNLSPTP